MCCAFVANVSGRDGTGRRKYKTRESRVDRERSCTRDPAVDHQRWCKCGWEVVRRDTVRRKEERRRRWRARASQRRYPEKSCQSCLLITQDKWRSGRSGLAPPLYLLRGGVRISREALKNSIQRPPCLLFESKRGFRSDIPSNIFRC